MRQLLELFIEVEKSGSEPFTNVQFKQLVEQYPEAAESNRVVMSALLIYTRRNKRYGRTW